MSEYLIQIAIFICIYFILAASLNLAVGFTGLINLGHIAFFGIGAYASALLTVRFHAPFAVAFFLSGVIAGWFGWCIMKITKRLSGDYFALAMLAFQFLIVAVFLNWMTLTRGPLGIPGIPRPSFFGYVLAGNRSYLVFALIIASAVFFFLRRLAASPYGRVLCAVRDDAIGAAALGKDINRVRSRCLVLSTFFAGIAGSLFAHFIQFIDPYSFHLSELILALTIMIVGGLASLSGTLVATIILLLVPEALRFLPIPDLMVGPLRQMLYSGILIGILLWRPRGIFGKVDLE